MTIQRVPETPFAQIANSALRDSRLSFRARGILAMVLSHTGDWEASKSWLMTQGTEGRDAIQAALNELTEFGYREVTHEQTSTGIRTVVVWKHSPGDTETRSPAFPTTGFPAHRESRPAIEHYPSEHHHTETPSPFSVIASLDHFEEFWDVYPRKVGKKAATTAFVKACRKASAQAIIDGARRFAADPNREEQFTPHPTTWLNQGRWEDDPLPTRAVKSSGTRTYLQAANSLSESHWELEAADDPF